MSGGNDTGLGVVPFAGCAGNPGRDRFYTWNINDRGDFYHGNHASFSLGGLGVLFGVAAGPTA
jgi:hypothetical protein